MLEEFQNSALFDQSEISATLKTIPDNFEMNFEYLHKLAFDTDIKNLN